MENDSNDELEAHYRAVVSGEVDDSNDASIRQELKRLYEEEGHAIEKTLNDFLE